MTDGSLQDRLRRLPAVDRVVDAVAGDEPRVIVASAARYAIDGARGRVRAGAEPPTLDEIVHDTKQLVNERARSLLQPVINATGVLIHTNLGRVPLGEEQLSAVERVASGYSNLEYDLVAGGRGSRHSHVSRLIAEVTGAETGLVVNNNAAAVLLTLAGLCARREIVVSRGELVEIGGEFRIPDVMDVAGAKLVEVGTTNRTHLRDYEEAIGENTAAILKVHPSNYRIVGFTASVGSADLARLARGRGLCFIHDVGSGLIRREDAPSWARREPTVSEALAEGADVVTFSGDKLLGGPQAGLIAGSGDAVDALANHPLIRALRVDKMTLAALERTLEMYLAGRADLLPLWSMADAGLVEVERRARNLVEQINSKIADPRASVDTVHTHAVAGGGSLPGTDIESRALLLTHPSKGAAELERDLRASDPPVIARVEQGRLLLDLRTVRETDDDTLAALVVGVLAG